MYIYITCDKDSKKNVCVHISGCCHLQSPCEDGPPYRAKQEQILQNQTGAHV